MATETRTTPEAAFAALGKIEHLARPGQTLTLTEAVDILCDIWNACREARTVTNFPASGIGPERTLNGKEASANA